MKYPHIHFGARFMHACPMGSAPHTFWGTLSRRRGAPSIAFGPGSPKTRGFRRARAAVRACGRLHEPRRAPQRGSARLHACAWESESLKVWESESLGVGESGRESESRRLAGTIRKSEAVGVAKVGISATANEKTPARESDEGLHKYALCMHIRLCFIHRPQ